MDNKEQTNISFDISKEIEIFAKLPSTVNDQQSFFSYPPVVNFYKQVFAENKLEEATELLVDYIPKVPDYQGALLALLCGCFVENGANPELAFNASCELMVRLLKALEPYCAQMPDEDEPSEEETARWQATEQRLAQLTENEKQTVDQLTVAVDILVLPIMAMVLRTTKNFTAYSENTLLLNLIAYANYADSVDFDGLDYLHLAAQLTYDEVVVILPATGTGLLVDAHAINNTFHAFTLLQSLLAEHSDQLNIGQLNADTLNPDQVEHARYHWLSSLAYEQGELKNELAMAWGEACLHQMPRKHGKLVLIGLEKAEFMQRSWNGFNHVIHSEQNAAIKFKRYLTAEEVKRYLE